MAPQHMLMAGMSVIVFAFAIAGTADYWFYRIGGSDHTGYSRFSLWQLSVKAFSGNVGTVTKYKVDEDIFKALTCQEFVDHFKAAEAFAIMTCIVSLLAVVGFVINITGNKAPIGIALAAVTIIFSMITWVIGTAILRQEFCHDSTTDTHKIHLDINNHNDVGYGFHRGWYFFLIPWILYVLCFIVAIIMDVLGVGAAKDETESKKENLDKKESQEEKKEENPLVAKEQKEEESVKPADEPVKARAAATEEAVIVKEDNSAAEAKKKADEQEKADEEEKARKEAEEKRIADEKARAAEEERLAAKEEKEMAKMLNEADVERRKKIWSELRSRLPTDKKNKEERRRRFDLFKEFDRGDKKYLTPADLDEGCSTVLGLGQLKRGLAHILPKAHANARAVHKNKGNDKKQKEENVERCEFRLVFVNIKKLFDLWFMFDTMDSANSGFITLDEFESGADQLKEWGKEVKDIKAEFAAVAGSNDKISFTEFCDYATANQLEEDEEDTDNDENPEAEDEDEARKRNLADVERRKAIWAGLADRLPTNKKSKEERARRFAYFRDFDTDSNGYLTLADVEEGCKTVLGLGQLGKGLHHILPLAHNSARGVTNVVGQVTEADLHVEKSEMRLLFVYIHQYFDLWFVFDTLDVANSGSLSMKEFIEGMPEVEKWAGIKIEDPKAEFTLADTGSTNDVTFLEFCEWAHHKNKKDE